MHRQEYLLPELGEPISHYTHAVRFGELLFVSGIAPVDEARRLVGGDDVVAQTQQVLKNLGRVLATAGLGPADVLKVTVFLTDIADRPRINPARQAFFGEARPASTLVEVSALANPGHEGRDRGHRRLHHAGALAAALPGRGPDWPPAPAGVRGC
jgi:2-iminobutanoate/2-iminopropanoate deaminase